MKERRKCSDFSHRCACLKHAWCALLAVSLLTTNVVLHAGEASESQANTHTASDGSALPANTVANSANTSVTASADGSMQPLKDATQGSEAHASNTVASKAVASDAIPSAKISASSTAIPSQTSSVSIQTASAGAPNNAPASPSTTTAMTLSSATGTLGTTNAVAANATNSTVAATNTTTSNNSATAIASSAPSNTATSSQTSPAPANIPLGSSAIFSASTPVSNTTPNAGSIPLQPTLDEEEEPQDLGDILDLRSAAKLKTSLLPWVIALLVVLSAVGLWFLLKRKRKGGKKSKKIEKPIDPYEEVLQALKEASGKLDVNHPKPFAFFLTDAVRLYLSRIFRLPAPECTTQELLQQLPWCTELTDELRTNITQFLQRCDLVKFTSMPFDETFLIQLHQQAEAIVAASHEITNPKPAPVTSVAPSAIPSSNPKKMSKK